MASYQYEAIPSPLDLEYTRVFNLAPGQPNDPLSGSLKTMSVADPGPFEALSYVWGWGHVPESIALDRKPLTITSSVAVALRRLRSTTRMRTVWVDQICINQKDPAERSQQVRHMNSIYQKADCVLVWLGLDDGDDAARAFALTKSLAAISDDPVLLEEFRSRLAAGMLDQFPEQDWVSLGRLFKLPYFDRKWVLQEIGTDAWKQLLWGDAVLDWTYMSKAADLLKKDAYALRRRYDLLVWRPWYMDRLFSWSSYEKKALNFTYELHRARWQKTGDPRDHLYALLGHPAAQEGPDGARIVEVDYTKPVEKVYHDFTVRMLKRDPFFMPLNTVQHATTALSVGFKGRNIPTWVTQWDSQENLHDLLGDDTCEFRPSGDSSSGGIAPNISFLDDNRVLSIDGIIIDEISFLGDVLIAGDITLESPRIAHLWTTLPESGPPGLIRGGEHFASFLETLSTVKTRKGDQPTSRAQRVADGADFIYRAATNGVKIADEVEEMSKGGDCRKWMERVSGGARGRRFARGKEAFFAMCPPVAEVGDVLCVLFGAKTPFCLRPTGEGYLFVGECYVEGVMDGKWVEERGGDTRRTTFRIR